MPIRSRKARRATIREVLDIAIELEKRTMALYVGFVQAFPRPEEVRNFWFSMARHEAGHCGALALVEAIVESDPARAKTARVWFDEGTVARLRALLTAYLREVRAGGVSVERAFEMAIDVEASELEDVVVDMLSVVRSPRWRERAIQLLLHDLGDLSYMVERYTKNEALLARADALIERHLGGLKRRRTASARATATPHSPVVGWAMAGSSGTRANGRAEATSIVTVPSYLDAIRRLHGMGPGEMARALRVSPSVLRRWARGSLVPSWRRLRAMTGLWGGSAEMLALG